MEVLNQQTCSIISGGDVVTFLGYVGLVSISALMVGLEYYTLQLARAEYEAIDFSKLTPREAYDLGASNAYLYCRHFNI